jgi:hypothetical protein
VRRVRAMASPQSNCVCGSSNIPKANAVVSVTREPKRPKEVVTMQVGTSFRNRRIMKMKELKTIEPMAIPENENKAINANGEI